MIGILVVLFSGLIVGFLAFDFHRKMSFSLLVTLALITGLSRVQMHTLLVVLHSLLFVPLASLSLAFVFPLRPCVLMSVQKRVQRVRFHLACLQ